MIENGKQMVGEIPKRIAVSEGFPEVVTPIEFTQERGRRSVQGR